MLHPYGRVSHIQEKQMTTIIDANVHNIAGNLRLWQNVGPYH